MDENSVGYRVKVLRENQFISQKQLAEIVHVTPSQISRLERGETTNAGTELIIIIAKYFHVSTDYLLGLTPVSTQKSYDISTLGLSEEAVRRLITGRIDADVLNRLLEHDKFPQLCALIRNYFDGTVARGVIARNELIDLATEPLAALKSAPAANRAEAVKDLNFLRSSKMAANEADIEKIKNLFLSILRDIKKNFPNDPSGAVATAAAFQGIREALPDKPEAELTAEDVSAAMAAYVETVAPMDEESRALFQELAKRMLEQISGEGEKDSEGQ
ncbi:MAG: helix-turn-helix domain-containing protein [Clostridiales bacterium]|nr:helix-turn-helix domain-containing protein [Clostridiales bacterium]